MPISPEEIATKEFLTSFRGYDKLEVEAYLRIIAADYRRLLHRLDKVTAPATPAPTVDGAAETEAAEAEPRTGENEWHDLLLLAQEERQEMLRAGEAEKKELVAQGHSERDEILQRAEQERQELLRSAQSSLEEARRAVADDVETLRRSLVEAAESEAAMIVGRARERAVAQVAAARTRCEALLAEVATQGQLDDAMFEDAARQLQLQRWHREKTFSDVVASLQALEAQVSDDLVLAVGSQDDEPAEPPDDTGEDTADVGPEVTQSNGEAVDPGAVARGIRTS